MDQTSTYTNLNAQPRTATARLIFPSALLLHLTTMLHTQTQGRRKLSKVGWVNSNGGAQSAPFR